MNSKPWWASRTLLLNAAILVVTLVQIFQGEPWFKPEYQAAIIAVANAVMRCFTDKSLTARVVGAPQSGSCVGVEPDEPWERAAPRQGGAPNTVAGSANPGKATTAVLLALLVLAGGACAKQSTTQAASATISVVQQLPGVVAALGEVALTAPVDIATKEQIRTYAHTAAAAAQAVSAVAGVAVGNEPLTQISAAVQNVDAVVQASSADPATKAQVSGYASWAVFAVKVAALIAPVVI